jgi:hypothetical protein
MDDARFMVARAPGPGREIKRIQRANTKHGRYRKAAVESQRMNRGILRVLIARARTMYKKLKPI